MIDERHIPDEAVEASARKQHEMDFIAGGEDPPPWESLTEHIRAWRLKRARAAIAAAINAWPKMSYHPSIDGYGSWRSPSEPHVSLPLTQEKSE